MISCLVLYLHVTDKTRIRPTWPLQYFWGVYNACEAKDIKLNRTQDQASLLESVPCFFEQNIIDQHRYELWLTSSFCMLAMQRNVLDCVRITKFYVYVYFPSSFQKY